MQTPQMQENTAIIMNWIRQRETISYDLACCECGALGIRDKFLATYGDPSTWIVDGVAIPLDCGELLTFIEENLN